MEILVLKLQVKHHKLVTLAHLIGIWPLHYSWGSQSGVLRPVALPRNLLEMQILGNQPRPTESESVGMGPAICFYISPLGDFDTCIMLRFEKHGSIICHL